MAQNPTVSLTAIPAKPGATRSSVATAKITSISTKESSHSTANAPAVDTCGTVAAEAANRPHHGSHREGRRDRAGALSPHVRQDVAAGKAADRPEGETHGRVDVGTGDVPQRVDHRQHTKAKARATPGCVTAPSE